MLTVLSRIALCAMAFVVVLVAPAYAGGPTSAILSVPGQGKTAALYYTDAEYEKLAELVEVSGITGSVDKSGETHESGPGVTVTWLVHDVEPWRVDRIYLNAEGGPWIATQQSYDARSIWNSPVVWHQAKSGKELEMLLDDLGVGQAAKAAKDFDGVAGAPVPTQTRSESPSESEAPAAAPAPAASETVSGVWWALGGLVGGILLTFGWMRVRSTRESEPADLDPSADWLAPQTRSTSA